MNRKRLFILILVITGSCAGRAALSFTGSYSQDFNSLASSGTANDWTDNSTISGWYADESTYRASSGTENNGALYSYGSSSSDRALGSISSSATATVYYGVAFQNNTGDAITALLMGYHGEEWHEGDNANTLILEYFIGDPSAIGSTQGGWTAVSDLNFTTPQSGTGTDLDGNAGANSASLSFTVTGLNIANGNDFWIRWRDPNDAGNDAGVAIDDFSIQTVPESGQAGLMAGAAVLAFSGFQAWRQRRLQNSLVIA